MMLLLCLLLCAPLARASFDQIDLITNIETIGIVVTGDSLPDSANVSYRINGGAWQTGHPLLKIDNTRIAGSLFGLTQSTPYEISISRGSASITSSATTQPEQLTFVPTNTIYVNANAAPGGNGSQAAPYRTIQQGVDAASPGSRVLVADGVYHEGVEFASSGTLNNWIQVIASGEGAILDGSETFSGTIWSPHPSINNVWRTNIGTSIDYLLRDSLRYYKYDDMNGLNTAMGHGSVPMSEGWFMNENDSVLTIRCLDDPNSHVWRVPRYNYGFMTWERDWLWIEGFTIRNYGQSWGLGIYARNASNLVVRRNTVRHNHNGIFVYWTGTDAQGNNVRVEYNDISDAPVDTWPWDAVKGTSMEGVGILAANHKGAIVRGNSVHELFNGIYTGRWEDRDNPGISYDIDAYENYVFHIGDDSFEPEGTCINNRFRNNIIDSTLVGISFAPITLGPAWALRNQVTKFFGTCMKFSSSTDGVQLIYHNTFWTDFADMNGVDFSGPSYNTTMRNNICRSTRYAIEITFAGNTGHDWNWDNWFTTRGASGPHFKWEDIRYDDIADLCAATGLECHGHESEPGLRNPQAGDVRLLSNSPNIDAALLLPGINDHYEGAGPDIGAYEFSSDSLPAVMDLTCAVIGSDIRLNWSYGDPTVSFTVYSTNSLAQPFAVFEGTTTATEFLLSNQVAAPDGMRFYIVVAHRP